MREPIISTETGQTADIRPLTDAELNKVSGGYWIDFSMRGTGEPLWQPLTTNWGSSLVLGC
jgi:hypothetical protein